MPSRTSSSVSVFTGRGRNDRSFAAVCVFSNATGLTVINDVSLEDYVTSVISSEMSASCPLELLKAHAVISRSWLCYPKLHPESDGPGNVSLRRGDEITRWYGREAHRDFDVCADDHCQRYQGITKAYSHDRSAQAVTRDGRRNAEV